MKTKPRETLARAKAREILNYFCVGDASEISVRHFAAHRGAVVLESPLACAEARLVHKNGARAVIRVSNDIPQQGRKRFAVAHELGHWELHRSESQFDLFTGKDAVYSYGKSTLEIEANVFASELLMPESLFRPRCDRSDPSIQVISNLSQEFTTTLTATAVRYVDSCSECCAAVFSKDGKVTWFRCRKEWGLWIRAGTRIGPNTYARDCFVGSRVPTTMERVPLESWFPERVDLGRQPLLETSMVLGLYGTVLTLLWIKGGIDPRQ